MKWKNEVNSTKNLSLNLFSISDRSPFRRFFYDIVCCIFSLAFVKKNISVLWTMRDPLSFFDTKLKSIKKNPFERIKYGMYWYIYHFNILIWKRRNSFKNLKRNCFRTNIRIHTRSKINHNVLKVIFFVLYERNARILVGFEKFKEFRAIF